MENFAESSVVHWKVTVSFYLLLNRFDSCAQMRNVVVLHVDGTHWVLEQVQVVGELLGEEDVHLLNDRVVLVIGHLYLLIK